MAPLASAEIASCLALILGSITLGGGIYETLLVDAAWPRNLSLIVMHDAIGEVLGRCWDDQLKFLSQILQELCDAVKKAAAQLNATSDSPAEKQRKGGPSKVCIDRKRPTRLREHHAMSFALKQPDLEILFQQAQLPRHCGLHEIQKFARARHIAGVGHGQECA
jgi:hypothetical protein